MRWSSTGIVLSHKPYSDDSVLVSVVTALHGKKRALAKVQSSNKFAHGNMLLVTWSGKSMCNLGYFTCEVQEYFSYYDISFEQQLAVSSLLSLVDQTIPENESQTELFTILENFLEEITAKKVHSPYISYVKIEVQLLKILGFALDLSTCAVTGVNTELKYISPKTGQALSHAIGREYENKLFPLPNALMDTETVCSKEDFSLCLKILGYFFDKHIFKPMNIREPEPRKLLSQITFTERNKAA